MRRILQQKTKSEKEIKQLREAAEKKAELAKLEEQNARKRLASLKTKTEQSSATVEDILGYEKELNESIANKEDALHTLELSTSELSGEIKELTDEKLALENELHLARETLTEVRNESAKNRRLSEEYVRNKTKVARDDVDRLQVLVNEKNTQLENATRKLTQAIAYLDETKDITAKLMSQVDLLTSELTEKKEDLATVDERASQLKTIQDRIRDEQVRLVKIRTSISGEQTILEEERKRIGDEKKKVADTAGRVQVGRQQLIDLVEKFDKSKKTGTLREFMKENNLL